MELVLISGEVRYGCEDQQGGEGHGGLPRRGAARLRGWRCRKVSFFFQHLFFDFKDNNFETLHLLQMRIRTQIKRKH